jgi:hypothetical protein
MVYEETVITLLCREEERQQRLKENERHVLIHNIWKTWETDGEFETLFNKLLQDNTEFKICL